MGGSLLQYLRSVGLTGCKLACNESSCGSCTVLVSRWRENRLEEATVTACSLPLLSLQASQVRTVEGLGSTKSGLHPVQARLHEGHGSQCGFCSPGMVMSVVGLLQQCPAPDIEDLYSGLQGNLCRCTGYRPIIEAFSGFTTGTDQQTAGLSVSPEVLQGMKDLSRERFRLQTSGLLWIKPLEVEEVYELMKEYPSYQIRQGGTGSYKKFIKVEASVIFDISGLEELKEIRQSGEFLSVGAGVTFTNLQNYLTSLLSSSPSPLLQELNRVLGLLASPQVRNIASLGGSLLWAHPASDLIPLLTVAGTEVVLGTAGSLTKQVSVEQLLARGGLERGELLLSVRIPTTAERRVKFYKHARRKTADLAIANMAVGYSTPAGPGGQKMTDLRIVVGGLGLAVEQCPQGQGAAGRAKHLESLLSGDLAGLSPEIICSAVERDLLGNRKSSQIEKMAFRVSLVTGFVIKFLQTISSSDQTGEGEGEARSLQSSLLYEKTPADQPVLDPVTRPVPHLSSAQQCTGEAVYVDDLPVFERELQLFPVQSTVSHAQIMRVDVSAALALPGVVAWISHSDIPGCKLWSLAPPPDEELFPTETVQYVGQIIGLVAAESSSAGLAGVRAVRVEFSHPLPPILTVAGADLNNSLFGEKLRARKDVREKNNCSLVSTGEKVAGVVRLGGQEHYYLEPHTALAVPGGEEGEITLHFSTQLPSTVQAGLAAVLGLPQSRITVKCRRAGGAFGGKERFFVALMAGLAAHVLQRPARLVLTREADNDTTGHRHETKAGYEVEHDSRGKIMEAKFQFDVNAGMSVSNSDAWVRTLAWRVDGGYTLSKFEVSGSAFKTNLVSNTAFRGFGSPEGALIIEDVIEKIALKLNLDPALVRQENLTKAGDFLHHGTKPVTEDFLIKCWDECLEQSNYFQVRKEVEKFNSENKYRKRGVAIVPMKFFPTIPVNFLNQAAAFVRVYLDGSVLLSHGGIEMGQGLHTKMVQVAARVLRVDMKKIHIIDTSTEIIANATPTGGSSGTDLCGFAVMNACKKLADALTPIRDNCPDDTWEQIVEKAYFSRVQLSAFGFYNTSPLHYDDKTDEGSVFHYLTFGVGCTLVEVDCLTGDHQVLRTDIVMDVGRSLNPAIDIGQIEGAFVQGYGYMTMEEMIHNKDGQILTNNLSTYKVAV